MVRAGVMPSGQSQGSNPKTASGDRPGVRARDGDRDKSKEQGPGVEQDCRNWE